MVLSLTRRVALVGGAILATAGFATTVLAAEKPTLKFSAVFSDTDIRAEAMRELGKALSDDFSFEPHFGATLFKQGTELVALQRGNLEAGIVAPQDIAKQIPSWSILSSAYLFRDAVHLKTFYASDVGKEMTSAAEEQLGVHIVTPVYFGTRQVNLKPEKEIKTPADMAGIKLRMPGGDAWQFLGTAIGANPTPMAYSEVYTGLQTGAIDGQDNPLPNDYNMKFYEVTSQIVLTSHLIGYDLFVVSKKTWDSLTDEQKSKLETEVTKAVDSSTQKHLDEETRLANFFKEQGLKVYKPDVDAFRAFAQEKYLESDLAKDWPEGLLDKINAL
ncbi:Neu5Ac-binding protein [Hartmannibacter diazotrophicus]|uniref:Neu5Ac-binding protein n=1 Tax=Hartmannibacter diazotrophicus TaxID=1482074 RepID=A0A2C9D5T7_9HYPH|nr:TRAP transporter substrate-binding protein DctP [Hartmannibacter diazotrophicus]SON55677.1 Neu5Ac-binding protein [Hartmannibacter diazotrophicus]